MGLTPPSPQTQKPKLKLFEKMALEKVGSNNISVGVPLIPKCAKLSVWPNSGHPMVISMGTKHNVGRQHILVGQNIPEGVSYVLIF